MENRVRYYVDEHIGAAIVKGLMARGVDVVTAKESGLLGAPDERHMEWATSEARVIITRDDDFVKLHSAGFHHAGIVLVSQNATIGETIQGLMLIYQVLNADDMEDQVEFV